MCEVSLIGSTFGTWSVFLTFDINKKHNKQGGACQSKRGNNLPEASWKVGAWQSCDILVTACTVAAHQALHWIACPTTTFSQACSVWLQLISTDDGPGDKCHLMDSDVQVTLKTALQLTPIMNTERNGFLLKESVEVNCI